MTKLKNLTRQLAIVLVASTMAACPSDKEEDVVFTVNPQAVTIKDGSKPTVSVQTNAEWYVSMVTESWLTAMPMSGSGNGTITLAANSENSTRNARSAQLIITERKTQQVCVVNVTQQPPTPVISVSTATVELASTGGQETVSVTANLPWLVSSSETWLSVTPLTGSGNGSLLIVAEPNTGEQNRTATITLAAIDNREQSVTISVTQSSTIFNVTPLSVTLSEDNGYTETVNVETSAQWSVIDVSESWLTATPSVGTGSATLTLKASNSSIRKSRIATVTLQEKTTERQQTITVTQQPPTPVLSASIATVELASAGGQEAVSVTSNLSWLASSSEGWLSVTPATGSGNGSLLITAVPNTGEKSRTATVTLADTDNSIPSVTISVTQVATLFSVTPLSVTLSEDNGNTTRVSIETSAQWSIIDISEKWLSATPSSGNGTTTLTLKANANSSRSSRTATVTLQEKTTERRQTISVTQLPPPATLTTDKQNLSFPHGAGNEYVAITSNIGWTVSSSASWCTVNPTQGTGNGSITVSVKRNEAFTPRTATITITPGETSVQAVTIKVTQAEYVEIKPGEGDNTTPAYNRTRK